MMWTHRVSRKSPQSPLPQLPPLPPLPPVPPVPSMPMPPEKTRVFKDLPAFLVALLALAASLWSSYEATTATREATKVTNAAAKYSADAASAAARETAQIANDVAVSSQLHDRLTMRPLFDFRFKIGVGTTATNDGFLRLENVGEGTGTIKSVEACFDGKVFSPSASALWENVSSTLTDASELQTFTLKKYQKVGKGGEAKVFYIPAGAAAATFPRDQERKKAVARLKIHVVYTSSYDDEDVVDLDFDRVEQTSRNKQKKDGSATGKASATDSTQSPGDKICQDWIKRLSACTREKATDGRIFVRCQPSQ